MRRPARHSLRWSSQNVNNRSLRPGKWTPMVVPASLITSSPVPTGRRIDAHHAPTHLTASFSRCVSRLGSGGRVEPKLQREWPSDPGQMVQHKNLMFPSSQVAPLTCARAVAPAVTTPSRHCSRHQQHPEPWWVSSVDLCTSFDVFGLLVYTISHRSLCTVGRGTGADPQRRAVLSWVYGRRTPQYGR